MMVADDGGEPDLRFAGGGSSIGEAPCPKLTIGALFEVSFAAAIDGLGVLPGTSSVATPRSIR